MRLTYLHIDQAPSCGGLLDGLKANLFRDQAEINIGMQPLCLLGPNGSGKSQFLQVVAELFQAAWHTHRPDEERADSNPSLSFILSYEIAASPDKPPTRVRLSRSSDASVRSVTMEVNDGSEYRSVEPRSAEYGRHLPPHIVGYTSGDNETLSLPFFVSRSEYADAVGRAALKADQWSTVVPDNRLLLIDYSTHLEVLIANLMIGKEELREAIIQHATLDGLASWRCVIQLNHADAPTAPRGSARRKGIQLTDELELYIRNMKNSATSWHYDPKTEVYTFDFLVDDQTRKAFRHYWTDAGHLYRSFHKLAMLNDLVISKTARSRIKKEMGNRHFASRLPEPQDESKVFRFEEVRFFKSLPNGERLPVDYVALSDGEHQQAQIFGVFAMMTEPNTLFLLDEPESHFNPQWRVKFISRLMGLPVKGIDTQEIILTSHAPFVASDISREQVRIFSKSGNKLEVKKPEIETYGATYDSILSHCFGIEPPISQLALDEIETLKKSGSINEIKDAMSRLGSSVQKAFLADRLRELSEKSN